MSFQESAKIAKEQLSKQGPITLEYARAQVLWLKFNSSSNKNKEQDIKQHLKMYHPKWTNDQIDSKYIQLNNLVVNRDEFFKIAEIICSVNYLYN